jgi:hypothetical protein
MLGPIAMASSPLPPLIAVTGSDKPYIYDLPHMLSLPTGFEFRFRYRPAWIEAAISRQLATDPRALRDRSLIVVFHSSSMKKLLPIRRCRVVDLEAIGAVVYLRFRVEEFVVTPQFAGAPGPAPAATAASDLHTRAEALIGAQHLAGADLSKSLPEGFYLREAAGADDAAWWSDKKGADAASDWARLAQVLTDEAVLWDVPMFYLLGFQREHGKYADVGPLLRSAWVDDSLFRRPRVRANKLVEGQRYRLRVLEWCRPFDPKNPLAVNVTCKFDDRMLQLESSASLVVGKYDVLEFSFLAKRPAFGHLELRADPDGKPAKPPDWPRLYAARVPVRVRPSVIRLGVVALCFVGGILVYQHAAALAAKTKAPESLWQLIGTLLIFVVLGEVVDRFLKFSKDLREYTQPPTGPAAKP